MNELEFRIFLTNCNSPKKVQSDIISRIKKLQRELNNCDIDECFKSDKCSHLLSLFDNKGMNDAMMKYKKANLPIGKYYLSAYKYALKKYISFLESTQN